MNVVVDTNVAIDYLLNRAPLATDAKKVMSLVAGDEVKGYLTGNSVADIFYLTDKHMGGEAAHKAIRLLLKQFSVIGVDGEVCLAALDKPIDDFEDALVVVCAENANLDYIITNDKEFLSLDLPVPAISPADFLAINAGLADDK